MGSDNWSKQAVERGPLPRDDGWSFLYRLFDRLARNGSVLRHVLCGYFWPGPRELAGNGRLYRRLGVSRFGRVIPTGGVAVRRLTGWRMAPYTLRGTSLGAARQFYYRTCAFEAAHLPFFAALLAWTGRQLVLGRLDLAAEDMVVNLAVNLYPIMHHRHTRVRIVGLLERKRRGPPAGP